MQETKTISEERPQQAAQVVPIEPSLRKRYWILLSAVIMFLFTIAALFLSFNSLNGNIPLYGYIIIWNHSLPGGVSLFYIVFSAIYVFPLKPWRTLNQRRQQAARYNMTVGAWARAIARPQSDAPALPDSFVVSTKRSWPITILSAIGYIFILYIIGIEIYSNWQETPQIVQQGVPITLANLNNYLNLAILLCMAAGFLISLIFAPKQQLIATRDGLLCRQGYRTSFIPWQQAQLFAIIGQANISKKELAIFYELASQDTSIRWPSTNKSVNRSWNTSVPTGVQSFPASFRQSEPTTAPFTQQIQFLNIIIAERTGLPLYDLC